MPTTQILRPLRPGTFQVHIAGQVAAVLQRTAPGFDIYILADEVRLLAQAVTGTPVEVAQRIAAGEFDNDMRFEVEPNPEPSWQGDQWFVTEIATPSQQVVDRFTTEDGYGAVAAFRECQEYSLEERWAMDAEAGR